MKKIFIPFLKISGFYVFVGFIMRIVLLFLPITDRSFALLDYLKLFFIGGLNDILVSLIAFIFFWLYLIFLSNSKYKQPWNYIIFSIFGLILGYLFFFKTIFDDYGSVVPTIVKTFVSIKAGSYLLLYLFPKIRKKWRYTMFSFTFFLYIFLIIFNAISEFLFWNEFGVRYNFIAVDYLIYTNEVIGNIMESYPIIPVFSILLLASLIITIFFVKSEKNNFTDFPPLKIKLMTSLIYIGLTIGSIFLLELTKKYENSENEFANELQSNGLFKFHEAFMDSSLNYEKFYIKLPINKTFSIVKQEYNTNFLNKNPKIINSSLPETRKNIILITIESMSAEYMQHFGNNKNLTPHLDKLANEGVLFTNLFATGNRTVRGLEALTLSIPPSPGESLIKRNNNNNLFSIGEVLRKKDYITQFLYGGYKYFDNMGAFYEGNHYKVIDRNNFDSSEITFANIWGVCDEDMFRKAIKVFDKNAKTGKPFFGHIMTVSNHRPFTYPDGKIDIPSNQKSRDGGVKYTDYAIGKFIEEAKKQSWFKNTVFVFVADHCASSAGKVDIPLDKYLIPAIIYAPNFIMPEKINTLCSQIDLMPTLFGFLNFSYTSHFYGQDVKKEDYKPRALIATYQKLGYYKDNTLIVLSPNRNIEQYDVLSLKNLRKNSATNNTLIDEAIANYQSISYLIDHKKLKVNK